MTLSLSLNKRAMGQLSSCLLLVGTGSGKCTSEYVRERDSPPSDGRMTSRISTALCGVIFESPEARDATLFMGILQADPTDLEKLGYPGASVAPFVFLRWLTRLLFINQSKGFHDRGQSAKQLQKRTKRKFQSRNRRCQPQNAHTDLVVPNSRST
jgi:hypothetical protein